MLSGNLTTISCIKKSVKQMVAHNALGAVYLLAAALFWNELLLQSKYQIIRKPRDNNSRQPVPEQWNGYTILEFCTSWQIWAQGCCHNRTEQATWDISLRGPRVWTCLWAFRVQEAFQIARWCHKNLEWVQISDKKDNISSSNSHLWRLTYTSYTF